MRPKGTKAAIDDKNRDNRRPTARPRPLLFPQSRKRRCRRRCRRRHPARNLNCVLVVVAAARVKRYVQRVLPPSLPPPLPPSLRPRPPPGRAAAHALSEIYVICVTCSVCSDTFIHISVAGRPSERTNAFTGWSISDELRPTWREREKLQSD